MHLLARLVPPRKAAKFAQWTLSNVPEWHVSQFRRYDAGTAQPTLVAHIQLTNALNASLDKLRLEKVEHEPAGALRLHFEELAHLDSNEHMVGKELLDGMLRKHPVRGFVGAKL
jgi:hypothetical protein